MAKELHCSTRNCLSCVHNGYCLIYWGADCKRQGGTKIPRVKSRQLDDIGIVDLRKSTKKVKSNKAINIHPKNKGINLGDPIRTRAFNW